MFHLRRISTAAQGSLAVSYKDRTPDGLRVHYVLSEYVCLCSSAPETASRRSIAPQHISCFGFFDSRTCVAGPQTIQSLSRCARLERMLIQTPNIYSTTLTLQLGFYCSLNVRRAQRKIIQRPPELFTQDLGFLLCHLCHAGYEQGRG